MNVNSGEALAALAALSAIQLARGRSVEEIELLASLFSALGENLSLLAAGQGHFRP